MVTRWIASSEWNFLKMFAFLRGSNWISPSSFREIFNVFPYWKPKSRDFKVFRNYLGFFWDWTSFSPRGFFLCSIFGKNVLVVLKLSLSICRPDFFYLICSLSLLCIFLHKTKNRNWPSLFLLFNRCNRVKCFNKFIYKILVCSIYTGIFGTRYSRMDQVKFAKDSL